MSRRITIARIIKATGLDPHVWVGSCDQVVEVCVAASLVKGRVIYGHYHGTIQESSPFHLEVAWIPISVLMRLGAAHAWVERPDGTIVDPTRWAFLRNVKPNVFIGRPGKEYRAAGTSIDAWGSPNYDPRAAREAGIGPQWQEYLESLKAPRKPGDQS